MCYLNKFNSCNIQEENGQGNFYTHNIICRESLNIKTNVERLQSLNFFKNIITFMTMKQREQFIKSLQVFY